MIDKKTLLPVLFAAFAVSACSAGDDAADFAGYDDADMAWVDGAQDDDDEDDGYGAPYDGNGYGDAYGDEAGYEPDAAERAAYVRAARARAAWQAQLRDGSGPVPQNASYDDEGERARARHAAYRDQIATPASAPARGGLQRAAIVDPVGLGQPTTALTIDIPAGWQTQGGIVWNLQTECVGNMVQASWSAGSPSGSDRLEIMPGLAWQQAGHAIPTNPCPTMQAASVREFLQLAAQQYRPGARVIGFRERPDLAQLAMAEMQQEPEAVRMYQQMQGRMEGGEIQLRYTAGNGQPVTEVLLASATFTTMQYSRMGMVGNVIAYGTTQGQPDDAAIKQMIASIEPNQAWRDRVKTITQNKSTAFSTRQRQDIEAWHARRMREIAAEGAANRSAIASSSGSSVGDIMFEGYMKRSGMTDTGQRHSVEAIGGYNTYSDPYNGTDVQASTGYDRVYRMDSGDYVGTNDPSFNPADGTELERY